MWEGPLRAANVAHLVECLPRKYKALKFVPHHSIEDMVHACKPYTLEMEAGESGVSWQWTGFIFF